MEREYQGQGDPGTEPAGNPECTIPEQLLDNYWLDTQGDVTSSVSPIDGETIAKVTNATAKGLRNCDHGQLKKPLLPGKRYQHPSVVRLFVRLDWPCASLRRTWVSWSPWKWERSTRRDWVKFRR